jgi:hypothetical protein
MKKDTMTTVISAAILFGCVVKAVLTLREHGKASEELNDELVEEK